MGTLDATLTDNEVLAVYRNGVRVGEASVSNTDWTFLETQPVSFTADSHGSITATGNSLEKTSGSNGWNAGVFSDQVFSGDVSVSFRAGDINTHKMFALNNVEDAANDSWTTLNYAIYFVAGGSSVRIHESGGSATSYSIGYTTDDVFTIERVGTTVRYLKNAVVFDTSDSPSTGDLVVDSALNTVGSSFTDINIAANVDTGTHAYTVVVEDAASGLSGTDSNEFVLVVNNISIDSVSDDAGDLIGTVENGGSTDDTTPTLTGTLGAALGAGQTVEIYNGGVKIGDAVVNGTSWSFTPSPALAEDSYSFSTAIVEGGLALVESDPYALGITAAPTVTVAITSADDDVGAVTGAIAAPGGTTDDTSPVLHGTYTGTLATGEVIAIYNNGQRLAGAATDNGDGTWSYDTSQVTFSVPDVNVTVTGNSLEKTSGGDVWGNAGVYSDQSASGDVRLSFTAGQTNAQIFTGLNTAADLESDTYQSIDFAFFANSNGTYQIRESNSTKALLDGSSNTYTATTVFAIERSGTTVNFYRDDVLVYTSGQSSTGDLYFDSSFLHEGGTLNNISFFRPDVLPAGEHSFTAVVENAAGLSGNESAAFTLSLNAITITSIADDVGSDTGVLASGDMTDDAVPVLSGTIGAALGTGESIQIHDDSGDITSTGTLTVSGTSWIWTPSADIALAEHNFVARIVDGSGDLAVSNTFTLTVIADTAPTQTVTIDTVTDDVAVYEGTLASGQSTNDDALDLAGTISAVLETGEVVAVYDGTTRLGEATVADGETTWTFTTPALTNGLHSISARVENTINGLNGADSAAHAVTISGISIDALDDNVGDPTGNIASGGTTDDSTPLISGSLNAALGTGETVAIFDGTTKIGDASVTGSAWTFTPTALSVGEHSLTARIIAADGTSVLLDSTAYVVTVVDSVVAPTQDTTILSVTDDAGTNGSVTGNVATGTTTDDTTLALSGDISAVLQLGEVVAIYDGATRLGEATVADGATTWSFDATLAAGAHTLTAQVENTVNGLASTGTDGTHTVHVQTLAITQISDDEGTTVDNILVTDATTDDTTPTLSGTLATALGSGEELAIYNGTTLVGVVGSGDISGNTWTFTPGSALAVGEYDLVAVVQATGATDISAARAVSSTQTITIANAVPTQTTTISSIADDAATNGSVTANIASGSSTDDNSVTISGTISAALQTGQVVAIYDTVNGVSTRVGEVTTTDTLWSFATATLDGGSHSFTARVENVATGTQAAASAAHVVQVQTLTVDSIVGDDSPTNNVLVSTDMLTDTTPTISGSVSVSLDGSSTEEIAVYNGNTLIAGSVNWNGTNWSFTPSAAIAVGDYTELRVLIQPTGDSSGTAGLVVSSDISISIADTSTPTSTPTIVSVTDDVADNGSVTGAIGSGNSTDDTTLVLTGTVDAALTVGQVVAIYDVVGGVNTKIGEATATSATTWEFTTNSLTAGAHSFTAVVENSVNDAQGTVSSAHDVLVQELAITAVTSDDGNVLAVAGNTTEDTTLTITGTASVEPGANEALVIYNGTTEIIGTVVWSGTTWTFTPTAALDVGTYGLTAQIRVSADGSVTVGSSAVAITVAESAAPNQIANVLSATDDVATSGSVTGSVADGTSTDDNRLALAGTIDNILLAGQVVAIYDGVNRLGEAVVDSVTWTFTTPDLASGAHTLSAIVESAGGTQSSNAASGTSHDVVLQGVSIVAITDDAGSVTGNLLQSGETSTDDRTPTLSGTLFANLGTNEELAIYNGTSKLGVALVDNANNTWTFTPATDLASGDYDFVVMVQPVGDTSGTAGRAVAQAPTTVAIIDEAVALPTASILGVTDDQATNGSVTGAVAEGTTTDDTQVVISGSLSSALPAGQQVVVYNSVNGVDIAAVGSAQVDGLTWTLVTTVGVANQSLSVRVEEPASDRLGALSDTYDFQVGQASNIIVNDNSGDNQGEVVPSLGRYVVVAEFNDAGIFTRSNSIHRYSEVEVWAYVNGELTNVALGKDVLGLSVSEPTVSNAVDGNLSTQVADANSGSQGLQIDLGQEYQIVSVTVTGGHSLANTQRSVGISTSPYVDEAVAGTYSSISQISVFNDPTAIHSFGDASGVNTYDFLSRSGTDDNTPTLSGTMGSTLGAGEVLAVYSKIDGVTTQLGTTTLNADSTWSFTPTAALADGEYLFWAQIEDATSGGARVVSPGRALSINASPVSAEVTSIELTDDVTSGNTLRTTTERDSSTGDVAAGTTTDDGSLTLSGTLNQLLGHGESVSIYDGATILGQATVDGTSWTYQIPETRPLSVGQHTLRAVVESSNGSVGTVDQTIDVTVQQEIAVEIDAIAQQDTVRYVSLYFETTSQYRLGELEIFSNGEKQTYSTPGRNPLAGQFDGTLAVEHGGNVGNGLEEAYSGRLAAIDDGALGTQWLSSRRWFYHDSILPGAFFTIDLGEDTQIDAIKLLELYTSSTSSIRVLTFENNPNLDLFTSFEDALANATHTYSISNAVGTGDHTLTAAYAATPTPTLSGSLQAALGSGEELAVYDNGIEIGTVTVNPDLSWSFTTPTLTTGEHSLVVQIQDSTTGSFSNGRVVGQAKNIVVASNPTQTVSIDSVGDDQGDAGSATGVAATGAVIDDSTPTISGTLDSALADGQVIVIYEGSTRLGEATVDGLNWSFQVPDSARLAAGSHTLTAQAENVANGSSGTAGTISFTLQQVDITGLADDTAGGATGNLLEVTGDSARYVRVELDSDSTILNVAEVQVWAWVGGELVNIAAGKTVTSLYDAADGTSLSAVTDGSNANGYVSAVLATDNYLLIDLGSEVVIDHITVVADNDENANNYGANTVVSTLDANQAVVSSETISNASFTGEVTVNVNDSFVSNDTTPVISGTLAVALTGSQVVSIYDNGIYLGDATVDTGAGTTWSYNATLTAGDHNLVARIVDGGEVVASSANSTGDINLSIDAGTPDQSVAITAATDDVADNSVTGNVASGTSSDDSSITLTGTVSAALGSAEVLAIYDGSTKIGEATVAADNSWSFTATGLASASHSFTAQVDNTATGTSGSASNAITVVTQSVSVTAVEDDSSGTATNLLSSTNNAEAAQFVRVENGQLGEVEVWAWVGGVLTNVAEGKAVTTSALSTTASNATDGDTATNSEAAGWLQIDLGALYVIDSIVVHPRATDGTFAAPRIVTSVATSHADLSGLTAAELAGNSNIVMQNVSSAAGDEAATAVWTRTYHSADTTPTLSGELGAALGTNEVVAIYDGTTRLGTANVSGTDWSFTASNLAAGEYQLRVQVEGAVSGTAATGRASSGLYTVLVDDTAPVADLVSIVLNDDFGPETGIVAPGGTTDDAQLSLSGSLNTTLTANQRVSVYDGSTFLGYADVSGTEWSFESLSKLSVGSHSVTAVLENIASGDQSSATTPITFKVQSLAITAITDDSGFVQGNLLNQTFANGELSIGGTTRTDDQSLTISGQIGTALEGGQTLRLYDGGAPLANITVNADLTWSVDVSNLAYADHEFSVQIEDSSSPGTPIISQTAEVSVLVSDSLSALVQGTTLNLGGLDRSLDLTQIGGTSQVRIDAIDLGDLRESGTNQVTLDIDDVLNAGTDLYNADSGWAGLVSNGANQLRIFGDTGDTVDLADAGWSTSSSVTNNGQTYNIYTNSNNAAVQLLIEDDLTVI